MVTAVGNIGNEDGKLILSPDVTPMTFASSLVLFLLVGSAVMGVAAVCALLGAWQVIPSALLVVGALAAALHSGYRRAHMADVVSIRGETVEVDKRLRRGVQRFDFQRGWAQVVLEPVANRHCDLFIRSHGRQVEIGAFLDDGERQAVADYLNPLMGPTRAGKPIGGAAADENGTRP